MYTLVNGEQTELISVRDRGLQYGDGCFETIRLLNHVPLLLQQHLQRLQNTCKLLAIQVDHSLLRTELSELIVNCPPDGVVKIMVTRGSGGRGYLPDVEMDGNRILMYHPTSIDYVQKTRDGVCVGISKFRLSQNEALSGLKHMSRLDQVMASHDLNETLDEVLCLDQSGNVIEASKSNIVLVKKDRLVTPDLTQAGIAGVMLAYLDQRFSMSGNGILHCRILLEDLQDATELFLCNSVFGIWPVRKLVDNATVRNWTIGPWTRQAIDYHHEVLDSAN